MKRAATSSRGIFYSLAVAMVIFLASCSEKDTIDYSSSDSENVQSESEGEAYTDDLQEMAATAVGGLTDDQFSGRVDETVSGLDVIDGRFKCATVTITRSPNSTKDHPIGTITIDFGTGDCTGPRGNVRKGKIIVNYDGRRFFPESKIVTTFDGYSINGISVEGTHTLTNVTPNTIDYPKFTIAITGGKLTFPDGTTITREQNMTREWQRASNPTEDMWSVTGSASGKNRRDKTYTMEITKALVYKRACAISDKTFIAVEGTKVFTTDNKQITIDFGDGSCDNKLTITINGKSKEVTVSGEGS